MGRKNTLLEWTKTLMRERYSLKRNLREFLSGIVIDF